MRNRFDRQLVTLNDEMIEMGSMIEKAIQQAITALITQDVDKAKEIIEYDEDIDHQEKTIENLCLKLLLQQQPVARDLRVISSALKMITDISEMAILMADRPYIKKLEHIQEMAKEASLMLVGSIEAFVNKDLQQAHDIIVRDDVVDDLFEKIKTELIKMIHKDPNVGDQAMDLLMVAKYLERIGDHACNIADWVIFSITGTHDAEK